MYVWIDRWTHECMHVHVCNSNAHIPRKSQAQATSMHTIKPSKHTLDSTTSLPLRSKKSKLAFCSKCVSHVCLENFYINVFEKRRQLALSEILSGSPGIQHISPKIQPGHQRSGILMFHSIPPLGVSSRGHADKTNSGLMLSDSQADMTAE